MKNQNNRERCAKRAALEGIPSKEKFLPWEESAENQGSEFIESQPNFEIEENYNKVKGAD